MSYPFNLFKAVYNFNHKKIRLNNYPMIQEIECTNYCNFSCWFCARRDVEERGLGFMSMDTFRHIVHAQNACMFRHTQLFMHGEPLLHPDLCEFINRLKCYSKSVGLTTNGELLTKEKSFDLLSSGLSDLCISFEGINREVYGKMRIGDFDKITENILGFVRLRNRYYPKVIVTISCIDCSLTHNGIQEFVRKWKKIVDDVLIFPLHNWGGILQFDSHETLLKDHNGVCFKPWYSMAVYWDGAVAPCCIYEKDIGLGNINESSILKIWNSKDYQNFRYNMLYNRDEIPTCKTCQINAFGDKFLRSVTIPNRFFPFSKSLFLLIKDFIIKTLRKK